MIYLISRNWRTFERGFINCLTDKCSSCYFPKFKAEGFASKMFKIFGSYFHEVEIVKKHFPFQKGFKFPRFANIFGNVFQTSKVEYFTVNLLFLVSGVSKVDYFHHTENI